MSDLLARLIAAGTPADLVAEVALELARSQAAQEAITERRAKDRERQAAKRQRDNVTSRDITGCSVTERDNPLPSPSPSFPPDPQTNPTPAHPRENNPRARKAEDFPKPDWADPQVWSDFMLNRKRKRMTNSATAYRGFLRDIDKHATADWPPGRLLEHAAAKGWASINPPENQDMNHANDRNGGHRGYHQREPRVDGFTAALRRVGNDETDYSFAGNG